MAVHSINKKKFEDEIKKEKTVVVKFTAVWCSPCKQLAPIFEEVSKEINAECYEIDVDKEPELAHQYRIMSVPTIIILAKGKERGRINGTFQKKQLKERILSGLS